MTATSNTPAPGGWDRSGYWGMRCWNGLSSAQQVRLITVGNLPIGYRPEGDCPNPADCEVTTKDDLAPGPRFYCFACAAAYLALRVPGA